MDRESWQARLLIGAAAFADASSPQNRFAKTSVPSPPPSSTHRLVWSVTVSVRGSDRPSVRWQIGTAGGFRVKTIGSKRAPDPAAHNYSAGSDSAVGRINGRNVRVIGGTGQPALEGQRASCVR